LIVLLVKAFNYHRYIPEKWKLVLDQYAYVAEKKQVNNKSMILNCDYFKRIKEQKKISHQAVINNNSFYLIKNLKRIKTNQF
jgi:hypothetical protein